MEFGSLVLEIRKKLNITQEQLAQELSISFSTVNRWENGHTGSTSIFRTHLS
ncbi:helix-turn-helix domain-containing protein [Oceanobacillus sp. SE10311]|uniref:helix-turn-helix domain-containing protein n=1 Tax=Oceanobacillus sp. SE10311 TaxID=3098289 RepID=UPI003FA58198